MPWNTLIPLVVHQRDANSLVPASGPSWGAPIAVSPLDGAIWVANPDAGSVSVIDATRLIKVAEIAVGQEPWSLAIAPDGGHVYVADRAAGNVVVVDGRSHRVLDTIPVGPEPGAIALAPSGSRAYVTLTTSARVAVLDTARRAVSAHIPVPSFPDAVAVTNDGDLEDGDELVYVTHLHALPAPGGGTAGTTPQGWVTVLDAGSDSVVSQIALAPDTHGFPNLLAAITLSGARAWVPHVRAAPELPNGLTTTVFAAVSVLDLEAGAPDDAAQLSLNDMQVFGSPVNNPLAAIPAPDGTRLYVILAGSDLVEVIDVKDPYQPHLVAFLATGANPRGMAVSADGERGYVMNYLSRSVTVLDLMNLEPAGEVTATGETLAPEILRGARLFNNASNPRLSQGSWISCASCHPDGGSDGVTWMLPDGPRQTPALWSAGATGPWHWTATFDELQDVEETIQSVQHGLGLAVGVDPPSLGPANAARSADLDALAAFLARGLRTPLPPTPGGDVSRGRRLFQSAGCSDCHGGAAWTASALPGPAGSLDPDADGMINAVLRDVGTLNPLDRRGASGFDPPSLLGVGLTAPYLHDGSMPSLRALLDSGHPDPEGAGNGLDAADVTDLARFLKSIGPATAPSGPP